MFEFTPSTIFFHPPAHIPRIVLTAIIFHLHICVHSIYIIFTLLHHFPISYPSHHYQPSQAGLILHTCSPIVYKKKVTYLLI
jgi:hypothetical protein